MLHRLLVLNLVVVLAGAALAACAPETREDGEGGDAGVGGPDASFIDARALPDGGPDAYIVYVHSKDTLYTMDPTSFALTTVGTFDAPGSDDITDLAVAKDGTIYVISKTTLYTADPVTAHVTFRATLSSSPTAGNVGLTFLPNDDLLATDKTGGIRSINTASGAVAELGTFSDHFTTAGDLVAVADGTMYAISDKAPGNISSFDDNWLIKVDPSNGHVTTVGALGVGGVFGAAFINGKVLVFTKTGQIVEVNPMTGAGAVKATTIIEFWGAGVTALVPGVG